MRATLLQTTNSKLLSENLFFEISFFSFIFFSFPFFFEIKVVSLHREMRGKRG